MYHFKVAFYIVSLAMNYSSLAEDNCERNKLRQKLAMKRRGASAEKNSTMENDENVK